MTQSGHGARWRLHLLFTLCTGIATAAFTAPAHAALVEPTKNQNWVLRRDLNSAQFSSEFITYKDAGYLMTDLDVALSGSSARYAAIWRKNVDGRGWAVRRDRSSEEFHDDWTAYRNAGMRLVDVEAYPLAGTIHWAGVWVQNKEAVDWSSHRGLTSAEHGDLFEQKKAAGWRIVDIGVYNTSNGLRYNSIWHHDGSQADWAQVRDMTRSAYEAEVDSRSDAGFQIIDFESYDTPAGQRYAAIWVKASGLASRAYSDRTSQVFTNQFYSQMDQGFRLIDFERYDTEDGVRYAGIWQENDARYRYEHKAELDDAITNYASLNNLPGISVVIVDNGNTVYRRGFGFADVNDNKTAHSQTVYNIASLAKVYGGTLAAKLEQDQQLRDGTNLPMELDLDDLTSSYLNSMPSAHQHTVAETLSHLGCVPHYNTNPSIANQTTHYATATAAVQSLWNRGVIVGCTPNTAWNYSTHGFTFAGAVLEQASGRAINTLLSDELFKPYGLASTRVMYSDSTLPANSLRATPYVPRDTIGTNGQPGFDPPHPVSNPNVETTYSNSSWKVLGGGIESNTLDVARFGWKVLNAEVVTADVRDNRLWTRVNASFTHGLGWAVGTAPDGRRIAEWNGTWPGSRTWLRAYRDEGLVIAIMSNRTQHMFQDLNTLASNLAAIVLPPPRAN